VHQISKSMMFVKAKVAGTVLLVLIVWGISSASSLSLPSAPGGRAECPMHRQSLPQRLPISHNCCAAGHNAAILQAPIRFRPLLTHVSFIADWPELFVAPHAIQSPSNLLISSNFEAILVSLRI